LVSLSNQSKAPLSAIGGRFDRFDKLTDRTTATEAF
jgi:hypothetical protein